MVRLPAASATTATAAPAGYFYAHNNKKQGPVSLAQLRQLAGAGQLRAGDMVLQAGTSQWLAASALPGLFPPASAASANGARPPLPAGWYYAQGRKRVGPVTLEMMHQLMAFGMIRPTDLVLAEGSPKWQIANSHPALSSTALAGNGASVEPAVRWFYAQKNQKHGPVCREFLQQLANDGDLHPTDMILPEGTAKWMRADALKGLFPEKPKGAGAPAPAAPPEVREAPPRAATEAPDGDSVFPDTKPVPAPKPVPPPPPPPPPPVEAEGPPESDDLFEEPRGSIVADDTARPRAWSPADSFVPDLSAYEEQPPSVVADDRPVGSVFDSFVGGMISAQPLPPVQKPRRQPASAHACSHCGGTAYCGWKWDSAGIMESGPACERCIAKSGLPRGDASAKVTCSFCQGKGFEPEGPESRTWRGDAVAWRLRGLACSDSGEYEQAVAAFTAAIDLEPGFADVYYDRGWAYLALGRTTEGEADLAEAARLSSKFAGPPTEGTNEEKRQGFGLFGWFGRKPERTGDKEV